MPLIYPDSIQNDDTMSRLVSAMLIDGNPTPSSRSSSLAGVTHQRQTISRAPGRIIDVSDDSDNTPDRAINSRLPTPRRTLPRNPPRNMRIETVVISDVDSDDPLAYPTNIEDHWVECPAATQRPTPRLMNCRPNNIFDVSDGSDDSDNTGRAISMVSRPISPRALLRSPAQLVQVPPVRSTTRGAQLNLATNSSARLIPERRFSFAISFLD